MHHSVGNMKIDLSIPQCRDDLADQILIDIDQHIVDTTDNGHRNHLGASLMGDECWRKLYYTFRWVKKETHSGRVLRLFNVGHMAEPRFVNYLKAVGFEVKEFADDGKQFRISGANGHYGGSLDGMAIAPPHYGITDPLLLEFKTNGTGSGYANVTKQDLVTAKPVHFAQISQYGYKYQIKYGLYLIENKNDSDITIKIVELDWNLGAALERKAEEIVAAKTPPPRISDNPAFFNCKFCNYKDICHHDAPVEKNCRSCRECSPVANGEWFCSKFESIVPPDFIVKGCDSHNGV